MRTIFEKVIEIGILFNFYGKLLTEKQYETIEQYYIHDLSLSEIAENLKISRQGVHNTLKRAEIRLYDFENKLGLIKKFQISEIKMDKISEKIENINTDNIDIEDIKKEILCIKNLLLDIQD